LWIRYIRQQLLQGELATWSVLLVSSSLSSATLLDDKLAGLAVGAVRRKGNVTTPGRYTIGRLVSPSDEAADLDDVELGRATELTRELWQRDTRKNKPKQPPATPSGRGIRYARPKARGLLLLYPLDVEELEPQYTLDEPMIGVAISFPASDTAREISYVVTSKYAEDADFGES
jgi:hypothetical protein